MTMRTKKLDRLVVNRLLSAFGRLSNADLYKLANLLEHPSAATSVSKLIREHINLREIEQSNILHSDLISTQNEYISSNSEYAQYLDRDYKKKTGLKDEAVDIIARIFEDRMIFPSTRDLINVIDYLSGVKLDYEEYKKEGRRKVIRHFRNIFNSLPRSAQKKLIDRFFKYLPKKDSQDEYGKLFQILTRNE